MVADVTPFARLGRLWDDHLINARELKMGFLEKEAVTDLLLAPINTPQWPQETLAQVVEPIYQATQGRPLFVQACGHVLVDRLNGLNRTIAQPEDLDEVFKTVLTQWDSVFRYLIPKQDREPLAILVKGGGTVWTSRGWQNTAGTSPSTPTTRSRSPCSGSGLSTASDKKQIPKVT